MPTPLIQVLRGFADAQNEAQLRFLDEAIQAIEPSSCTQADFRAMFDVFERFPDQDGYGVFWGILHALEACDGYEQELLASIRRMPCGFNVLMVNRLLNAGVVEVERHSLEAVLRAVVLHPAASAQAIHDARRYLASRDA